MIAADMNVYADALEKACAAFGIPVFMDHKKSILLNSFVEYVRSLLAMAEQNFTYVSVFRHLRTGLCGFTDEEIDPHGELLSCLGIKGYKKWQQDVGETDRMGRRGRTSGTEPSQSTICGKDEQSHGHPEAAQEDRPDVTLAVYGYIAGERLQEQLAAMEQKFQAEGELAPGKGIRPGLPDRAGAVRQVCGASRR